MKKIKQWLYPIIILALFATSCEQPTKVITETVTETVYVDVIPDDPALPDNYNVIGEWEGDSIYWDFNADYTYFAYHPADMSDYFSGTYEMVERESDGKAGVKVSGATIYWIEILDNYPEYDRTTMVMENVGGYLFEYLKVGD